MYADRPQDSLEFRSIGLFTRLILTRRVLKRSEKPSGTRSVRSNRDKDSKNRKEGKKKSAFRASSGLKEALNGSIGKTTY